MMKIEKEKEKERGCFTYRSSDWFKCRKYCLSLRFKKLRSSDHDNTTSWILQAETEQKNEKKEKETLVAQTAKSGMMVEFVGSETNDVWFCGVKSVNQKSIVEIHQKRKTSSLLGNRGLFPNLFSIHNWAR